MQVEILSVNVNSKGKYQEADIAYKDKDGKTQGKKIVSFGYPEVFKLLSNAKANEIYEIKAVKENNFWNWAEAKKIGETTAPKAVGTPRSTYETPEERAMKQVFIVRQSSLSNAIEFCTLIGNKKVTPGDILDLASTFEDFVFNGKQKTPMQAIQEMEDDIPL